MGRINYLFTSESVTEGHPDKVSDQISDGILDELLKQDPYSRVACETLVTTGLVLLAGEITTKAVVDYQNIARETIKNIGYTKPELCFDYKSCSVLNAIHEQSPDIAMGVSKKKEENQGAGDQGLMFGYATNETKELMPTPILLAHKLTARLAEARKNGEILYLRPDGKSQVTVEYIDRKPSVVDTVVISTQHDPDVEQKKIREDVIEKIIKPVIPDNLFDKNRIKYFINPTGRFEIGGPHGDSGLTGRKIIVDTYGGVGSHGGGSFSGKDPSKVDRSASYMARYLAKNIVAAKFADQCEVQLAYAIGVAEPVSVMIDTFGTYKIPVEQIKKTIRKTVDLRPAVIIKRLKLRRPIFQKTAAYGHFGRELPEFTWEKRDLAKILKKEAARG